MNHIEKENKIILWGASFNPPHIGHFSAMMQMLEKYDKIVLFPYPKDFSSEENEMPPMSQRMKMLSLFIGEFFPKLSSRIILRNLSKDIKEESIIHGKNQEIFHTYDYLKYVERNLPANSSLDICLGLDNKKENFYKEEEIKKEFGVFYLKNENKINSVKLREFFSSHKNLKNQKDEAFIKNVVGNSLAEYIFSYNLYGMKKNTKKIKKTLKEEIVMTENTSSTKVKLSS